MRQVIFIVLLLVGSLTVVYGQTEKVLNYQRQTRIEFDTVLQRNVTVTYFVMRDTTGDVVNGNYEVKVVTMDSLDFVLKLYELTESQYTGVGNGNGAALASKHFGDQYKSKAAEITGGDAYPAWAYDRFRPQLVGTYVYRRGGQSVVLNATVDGRFRTQGGAQILRAFPLSTTWGVWVDNANANEQIEFFKVSELLWVGNSKDGRVILRKQ